MLNAGPGWFYPLLKRLTTTPTTQEHYQELHLGGQFVLAEAYAEVFLTCMLALTFGSGLPLMYPVAAVALAAALLDTKWKLLWMWQKPHRFKGTCSFIFLRFLNSTAFLHVCTGAWMYSWFVIRGQISSAPPSEPSPCHRLASFVVARSQGVFGAGINFAAVARVPEDQNDSVIPWSQWSRVLNTNTIGHVVLFCGMVLVQWLPVPIRALLGHIGRKVPGLSKRLSKRVVPSQEAINFSDAIQQGLIQEDECSYNLLDVDHFWVGDPQLDGPAASQPEPGSELGIARRDALQTISISRVSATIVTHDSLG